MRATVDGEVLALDDAPIELGGYRYFRRDTVRLELLEPAPRDADDLQCPHGVQFYDVCVAGRRYSRAAWSYESPRPALSHIRGMVSFWNEVEVG